MSDRRLQRDSDDRIDRRMFLAAAGTATASGLAGCAALTGGDDTPGEDTPGGDETATTPKGTPAPSASVSPSDCEPETISENVTQDTTWSAGDCPRVALDGDIHVRNGATLTIEPGVEVVAKSGAKLTVKGDGTLEARGGEDPILFYGESMTTGYWRGIEVESDNANALSRVLVRDGGSGGWSNVWVQNGAKLAVESSSFAGSATAGLVVQPSGTISAFSNNTFTGNKTALRVGTPNLGSLDSRSTYAGGNKADRIVVESASVKNDATWPATDAPLFMTGDHHLEAAISVDPGAQFVFEQGGKLTVKGSGSLAAKGSSSEPITLEGANRSAGDWRGIEVESNKPKNALDHVVVRDGGSGGWSNVWVQNGAQLAVTNSTFANSETAGLVAEPNARLTSFATNEFSNNASALRVATTLIGSLDANSTYAGGNKADRIVVESATLRNGATWPATDAPLYMRGDHHIEAAVTVDPGAQFVFEKGAKLTVKSSGSLAAKGSSSEPITLEGANRSAGDWRGIEVESNKPKNALDHVVVRDGGGGGWSNVWVQNGAQLSVTNSTFANSETAGLVAEPDAGLPSFATNEFSNNASALRVATTLIGSLDANSTYAGGNTADHIVVESATLENDATWPATDAPLFMRGDHHLEAAVTVDPGAQFVFEKGAKLTVKTGGAFSAEAGGGETITMVGESGSRGDWRGIEIESNDSANVLDNTKVAHGGGGGWANIWVQSDSRATVKNSTIADSATWGIVVESGASFSGSNNTYSNNKDGGIDDRRNN